jgi:GxxExxY protein
MNASEEPRMDANERELILKQEVFEVVGCAMEVLNELGHGLLEKPYENALVVEFGLRRISFQQQPRYDVVYKGVSVGEYVPDLITHGQLVVDTKVIERIGDHEIGQMMNYLKMSSKK